MFMGSKSMPQGLPEDNMFDEMARVARLINRLPGKISEEKFEEARANAAKLLSDIESSYRKNAQEGVAYVKITHNGKGLSLTQVDEHLEPVDDKSGVHCLKASKPYNMAVAAADMITGRLLRRIVDDTINIWGVSYLLNKIDELDKKGELTEETASAIKLALRTIQACSEKSDK